MTTQQPRSKAKPDAPPARVAVVWIGPTGHHSDRFGGELVPGRTYQCEPDLAAVLVTNNADFWRTPEE